MRPPLHGTVLITGASSGIGLALATQIAPTASRLILVARRTDRLHALAEQLRARHPNLAVDVAPCDLEDLAAVDRLAASLAERPVDVLINNAGFGDLGLFERADVDKLQRMILVNVSALTRLTRHLVPGMVQRRAGGVLNVSSGFGLSWVPGAAAYIGTKHYVTGFTESLRSELRPAGVVVTQACPGPVATEFEAVAENSLGQSPPSFVEISAEQCAREVLTAFQAGRALVVPGFRIRWVLRLTALTPRWLSRIALDLMGAELRRRLGA